MNSEKVGVATLIERAEMALVERKYEVAEDNARALMEWYPQKASQAHLLLGHVFMQKQPPRLGVAKWHLKQAMYFAQPEIENATWVHFWACGSKCMGWIHVQKWVRRGLTSAHVLIQEPHVKSHRRRFSPSFEDVISRVVCERSLEVGRAPNFRTAPTGPLA